MHLDASGRDTPLTPCYSYHHTSNSGKEINKVYFVPGMGLPNTYGPIKYGYQPSKMTIEIVDVPSENGDFPQLC